MSVALPSLCETTPFVAAPRARPLPRILYAIALEPGRKFGSLEEQMVLLAKEFRSQGSIFLPLYLWAERKHATGTLSTGNDAACLDLRRFHFATLKRLLALIRDNEIQYIHWNFSPPLANSYIWWLTLIRPRLKHLFTDHNSRFYPLPGAARGWKAFCKRLLLRRYSRVMCVSRFVEHCLEQQQSWPKLVCCHHFINTSRFRPDAAERARVRAELNTGERFMLLTVAHLIEAKGIDVFLRALAELPAGVVAWVIGDGLEIGALRDLATELKIAERVRFLGPCQHVEPYLQAADCFVCPSLWAEAAGLVNLEAQACGLPVIASDVGGIPEYVQDGRTGFLFPRGEHFQLAERVRRLLAAPLLGREMGENGRRLVRSKFSPEARLADFLNFYRE